MKIFDKIKCVNWIKKSVICAERGVATDEYTAQCDSSLKIYVL